MTWAQGMDRPFRSLTFFNRLLYGGFLLPLSRNPTSIENPTMDPKLETLVYVCGGTLRFPIPLAHDQSFRIRLIDSLYVVLDLWFRVRLRNGGRSEAR